MALQIGNSRIYPSSKSSSSRVIKSSVKLFGRKSDVFTTSAPIKGHVIKNAPSVGSK